MARAVSVARDDDGFDGRPPTAGAFDDGFDGRAFDGGWLRRAILLRGWTAVSFAAEAGISPETVYNAINGKQLWDNTVLRIYDALGRREPIRVVR